MILSTCEFIANKKITENLGIARGSTVRARNALRDLMAGLKSVVGGEIEEYTKLQAYAREQAVERMIEDAKISAMVMMWQSGASSLKFVIISPLANQNFVTLSHSRKRPHHHLYILSI